MATLRQNLISAAGASCLVMGSYWGTVLWRSGDTISGFSTVIDGDTIDIGRNRVRIYGIDAPEMAQTCTSPNGKPWACGREAKIYLERITKGNQVVCTIREHDVYGRIIGICKVGGTDLGRELVRYGYAVAYRRYSEKYTFEEASAINAKRGIWAGTFQPPESWRREHNDWQGR